MPAEVDIRALEQRISEIRGELDAAKPEYDRLRQTDPMAAEKFAAPFRGKQGHIAALSQMVEEKRQELINEIKTGKYLDVGVLQGKLLQTDKDGRVLNYEELGLDEPYQATEEFYKKRTGEVLSVLIGENVEMDEGLNASDRIALSFLSPEKQDQILSKKFAGKTKNINVAGTTFRLFQENGKWRPVNPIGFQASDLAMLPAEIAPTIGAIGGAVLGTGATGGPWGGAMGAAGGYTALGTIQDRVASSVMGAEQTFAEDLGRRSLEGMVGVPIDMLLAVPAAKFGARKLAGKKSPITFRDEVREAEKLIERQTGEKLRASDLLEGGLQKAQRRLEAAERRPGKSQMSRDAQEILYRVQQFKDNATPLQKGENLYGSALRGLQQSVDQNTKMVSLYNSRVAQILEAAQRKRMESLVPTYQTGGPDSLGRRMSTIVTEAAEASEKAKKEAYDTIFYPKAIPAVGDIDPVKVARVIEAGHYAEAARSAEVTAITMELRARPRNARKIALLQRKIDQGKLSPKNTEKAKDEIEKLRELSGPLNAKSLDKYIRRVSKAHPETLVGGTEQQIAAGRAANAADAFRRRLYQDKGVLNLYDQATQKYDAFRQFDKTSLGSIVQDATGYASKTATGISNAITGDPEVATRVLDAVRKQIPGQFGEMQGLARDAYLRRIGIKESQGMLPSELTHDPEMVAALWGRDEFGRATPGAAKRMNKILDDLHRDLKTYKLDSSKIQPEDLDKLQTAFDPNEFSVIRRNILNRVRNEQESDKVLASTLVKIAKKGHREAVDSHEFPRALWSASADDVAVILKNFSDPSDISNLKGDYMGYFFAHYKPKGEYGPYGTSLWDGKRFLDDIAKNPNIKRNMEAVLGKSEVEKLMAHSKIMQAVRRPSTGDPGSRIGGKFGESKINLFMTLDQLMTNFGDRYHEAMYRANLLPLIGKRGKDIDPKIFQQEYQKALKLLFTTSAGIQALTMTGRHDPNWGGHIGTVIGNMTPQFEGSAGETYDRLIGRDGVKDKPSERGYK